MKSQLIIKNGIEHIDLRAVHRALSEKSYWAAHIPYETVEKAFRNSYCVSLHDDGEQAAFARVITDYATFAYLCDVYVEEKHRGKSYGKLLMQHIMNESWVDGIRRFMLATRDAHGLYEQSGFLPLKEPQKFMELTRDLYQKNA